MRYSTEHDQDGWHTVDLSQDARRKLASHGHGVEGFMKAESDVWSREAEYNRAQEKRQWHKDEEV